jgi:hypothetical protein
LTTNYKNAPEVKEIAEELIDKYHQHIRDFNVRIDYLFMDKVPMKGDNEVWGMCKKITSLNAYLAADKQSGGDPFFVIIISEPIWEVLSKEAKVCLVDHELSHTAAEYQEKDDEEPVLKLSCKPHDMEEFAHIVKRYGAWRQDIQEFVNNARKKKVETTEEDVVEEELE